MPNYIIIFLILSIVSALVFTILSFKKTLANLYLKTVLRIPNEVVLKQSDIAMTAIIQELTKRKQDRPHPPSAPSPNLGEGK